ncbi:MAG: hypothetical protein AAF802_01940 [Planctomycetota bacterium]
MYGLDPGLKTKLVRHQDSRYCIKELIQTGWFDLYQSIQPKPVFKDCEQIVVFLGDGSNRARFHGVYRVESDTLFTSELIPPECPYQDWTEFAERYYELTKCEQFADLEGRVIVDWGAGTLAWYQHLRHKRVIEIEPPGRLLTQFNDYLDFSLSYAELKHLIANPKAHEDWKAG